MIMHIALIYDPASKHSPIWHTWLKEAGHTVEPISTLPDDLQQRATNFDLSIPIVTIQDYVDHSSGRFEAAAILEQAGVATLNPATAIAASSDKKTTYEIWQKHSILQPKTYVLDDLNAWPDIPTRAILKPVFGHSGDRISLVDSLEQAKDTAKDWKGGGLLQEYLAEPQCIRVIASPATVMTAYEKVSPGEAVVNVDRGASRKTIAPSPELNLLAKKMVESLGGGLMGVDILKKGNKLYALEANVPFGFDENDQELRRRLMDFVGGFAR